MRYLLIASMAVVVACSSGPASKPQENTSTPESLKILLIGDSIMLGYHASILRHDIGSGWMEKHRVTLDRTHNLGQTENALLKIGQFLNQDLDVIHFNFGLHDIQRKTEDGVCDKNQPRHTTPAEYRSRLKDLVRMFQSTGAKVIFATTTPVPDGAPCQIPGDVILYNQIALEVMGSLGIQINDLYSGVLHLDGIRFRNDPNQIHFNGKGNRILANAVIASLKETVR